MWVEGRCKAKDFPSVIKENLTTIPVGQSSPLWEQISSNIGTTANDDGYVFHSKGTSGVDNLYIIIKNAELTDSSIGHNILVTDKYIPNTTDGQNGTIGDTLSEQIRYDQTDNFNGANMKDQFMIWYGISITKDRVIIVIRNPLSIGYTNGFVEVIYAGLINRYSKEVDSSAISLVTTHSAVGDYRWRMLRNKLQQTNAIYDLTYRDMLDIGMTGSQNGRGSNNTMFTTPSLLYNSTEGIRGEVDGMLFSVGFPSGNNQPYLFKKVKIGEKNYIMASYSRGYTNGRYSKFAQQDTEYSLFIEMK